MKNSPQLLASDPAYSCWVNASAGTGKTKVLIDRILRLLSRGAKPQKILCLTFSRAAASEIRARLDEKLRKWASLTDADLASELVAIGEKPSAEVLARCKALPEKIRENALVIQTVHSFCGDFSRKFSRKPVGETEFRIMEDFEEKVYSDLAFRTLLRDESELETLEDFLSFHTETALFEYLNDGRRTEMGKPDPVVVAKRLNELFDIDGKPDFPMPSAAIVQTSEKLFNVAFSPSDDHDLTRGFAQIFLTRQGTVRKNILSKAWRAEFPETETVFKDYAEKLAGYYSRKLRYEQTLKSLSFRRLRDKFDSIYADLKRERDLWDFNDLIDKTIDLFDKDAFDEILLALSYEIDHLLVDEAQDTSARQWKIIRRVFESLTLVQDPGRTVFAVGDAKQLIYGFQGAAIDQYEETRKIFEAACPNWREIDLGTSYRSFRRILETVDIVFEKSEGLGSRAVRHSAFHRDDGVVEALPSVSVVSKDYDEWPTFAEIPEEITAEDVLADRVIDYIVERNLDDAMVLTRRRGRATRALAKRAKARGISFFADEPVNLPDKLIVKDLLSIVEFVLMPLNELNLAALLKTDFARTIAPVDEELLFDLCHNREKNLWDVVQEKLPKHAEVLRDLFADARDPYRLFLKAYQALDKDDYYLNRFMEDVFKRMVNLDLGTRDLIENVYAFPPKCRHPELSRERALKILTIHGAKGLEAKTAILLDDGDKPGLKHDTLLFDPVLGFWFLKPVKRADTILTEALKEYRRKAVEFEYERLLYVALTRAKERLVVCGIEREEDELSWYRRVSDAMAKVA